MKKLLLLLFMVTLSSQAYKAKFESSKDYMIYHYSYQLACYTANNNPSDKNLNELIKFLDFMNPEDGRGTKIKKSLMEDNQAPTSGRDSMRLLTSKLKDRAKELPNEVQKEELALIYLQIADLFVNLTPSQEERIETAKKKQASLDLDVLYTKTVVPKKVD